MNALSQNLVELIRTNGPITVARYMAEALGHPDHGYYMKQDPFGVAGDFITAPEISQMFGEIIGLWLGECWQKQGSPTNTRLVELGPGRGTLMQDALRAMSCLPGLANAIDLHLVETSPFLKKSQEERLDATWHDTLNSVPDGPLFLIANEFFDALPIHQYIMCKDGFRERLIDEKDGKLLWTTGPVESRAFHLLAESGDPFHPAHPNCHSGRLSRNLQRKQPDHAKIDAGSSVRHDESAGFSQKAKDSQGGFPDRIAVGEIIETCPAATAVIRQIADRIASSGGMALIIDYGYADNGHGDSLQALKCHEFQDVLAMPGDADITAHVNFSALESAAQASGVTICGPVYQGDFLTRCGIATRAGILAHGAKPEQRDNIATALTRLTASDQMGHLFKVMAILPKDAAEPPGFEI